MEHLKNWTKEEGKLVQTFSFSSFQEALSFIKKVGDIAQAHNHHPEIWNSYSTVKISLFTHDANAVTQKDISFAEAIDVI